MGLRMILTLEKCFTVFFDRVFNLSRKRKRRKKEKKKKRKKYDQKKKISVDPLVGMLITLVTDLSN